MAYNDVIAEDMVIINERENDRNYNRKKLQQKEVTTSSKIRSIMEYDVETNMERRDAVK